MRVRLVTFAAVVFMAAAPMARAQAVAAAGPPSRVDAAGSIGWLNANKTSLSDRSSNDWYNRSLYAGASLGWYWTDHLKTEVEGGVSSSAELRVYSFGLENGRNESVDSTFSFVTRRITIGQLYQFGRNAWVHPFAGVGLDLTWEQTDRTDSIYSSIPVRSTAYPRHTELLARPFATFGLKAYFAPRAFFRTDLKLAFDKGVDEALLRVGLGVDF